MVITPFPYIVGTALSCPVAVEVPEEKDVGTA
jgi:hypothetical protein